MSVANIGEKKRNYKSVTGNTYLGVTGSKLKLLPSRSGHADSKLDTVQSAWVAPRGHRSLDTGTRSPGSMSPGRRIPGSRSPGSRILGSRSPGNRSPGSRTPGSRSPGSRSPGSRSPGSRSPGRRIPSTRSPGTRSPGTRSPGTRSPGSRILGSRSPGSRTPGSRSPGRRIPGTRTLGSRSPGSRTPGSRSPGRIPDTRSPGRRIPGSRSPGRRIPSSRSPGRRMPGTRTLSSRIPGSRTHSTRHELESGKLSTGHTRPDHTAMKKALVTSRNEGRSIAPPLLGPRPLKQAVKRTPVAAHKNVRSKSSGKKNGDKTRIRTCYLQRKYFARWSRKVFGRVLPSVARQHHATRCQRRVLRAWRDHWWVEHREWKLGIRAECHNRYRVWIKVWRAWTSHTHSQRLSKEKNVLSMQFLRRARLRQVWCAWSTYVQQRRVKKLVSLHAAQWHLEALKRRCWQQWGQALALRLQQRGREETALHHWATRLQCRVWQQWRRCYDERLMRARKMALACAHWDKNRKLLVLRAWVAYAQLRRYKMLLRGTAVNHHSSTLLLKSLTHWRNRFARSRQIKEFKDVLEHKSRASICRRVMVHWKFYVSLREHKAHLCQLAEAHYTLALKCKSVRCFRQHAAKQRRQSQLCQLAWQFHVRSRQRQCWGRWVRRCEHNEEMALGPLTRKARGHVGRKRAHKVMAAWVEYVLQCRHRKRLEQLADEHFKESVLPKCFEAFRGNVAISRYKQGLADESRAFRRETLLSMVFYKWWRASRLSQDLRMLERVAILHWEERAKKRLLVFLREQLRRRQLCREQEERAVLHFRETVTRRAFITWRGRWLGVVSSASQFRRAASHDALVCSRRVWLHWRKHVCQKRGRRARLKQADSHYQITVFTKAVVAWKEYHSHARLKSAKLRKAVALHQVWLQRHAMHQWREEVEQRRHDRELYSVALSHHSHSNLLKHFRLWWEVAVASRDQREREEKAVREARTHLTRLKARRMLCAWQVFAEKEASERVRGAWASCHYQRLLRRRVLEAWRTWHATLQRKRRLSAQCQCFERSRLLSGCYIMWRRQFMCELKFKQKVAVSLWHWSHMLELKVLGAWRCYVVGRRRKAERYAGALQRHRAALVRLGVKQWIKVAAERKSAREEAALSIQAKNAQGMLRCVRRCAQHWRQLTWKNRLPRLQPAMGKFPGSSSSSSAVPAPPTSVPGLLGSADVWTTLTKELGLPEPLAGVAASRPQPRRPEILTSCAVLGESLPRLLPPPPPQVHRTECPDEMGGASLDVTDEPSAMEQAAPLSLPTGGKLDTRSPPPSHTPSPSLPGLPESHPLRNAAVQDEIRAMRQAMRNYFQLKLHQKSLREELAQGGAREHRLEVLKRELAEVSVKIREREPLIRDVAAKVNRLLQLCV